MAIDIYNWVELSYIVKKIPDAPAFLTKEVFKNRQLHATETIAWEVNESRERKSKFVARNAEPSPTPSLSRKTYTAQLPRIFDNRVFPIEDLVTQSASVKIVPENQAEILSNTDKIIMDEIAKLKQSVQSTIEWMCAQALSTGKIEIDGDNVHYEYDFGFVDNVHKLNPTADWSTQNAKIVKDIRSWKSKIYNRTRVNPDICLLGSDAASAFIENSEVRTSLNTINYRVGALNLNEGAKSGAIYIGTFLGVDFYEYIWDLNGNTIGSKMAVMLARTPDFVLHFGGIYRVEENNPRLYTTDMLVQTLNDRYRTKIELTIESKPLPVIHNPDLVIVSQVIA